MRGFEEHSEISWTRTNPLPRHYDGIRTEEKIKRRGERSRYSSLKNLYSANIRIHNLFRYFTLQCVMKRRIKFARKNHFEKYEEQSCTSLPPYNFLRYLDQNHFLFFFFEIFAFLLAMPSSRLNFAARFAASRNFRREESCCKKTFTFARRPLLFSLG